MIADEYIGNGDDRVKNRDGYTEMLGDLFFTIPAIKAANAHRGNLICLMKDYTNLFKTQHLIFTVTYIH